MDRLSAEQRHKNMAAIRGKDTKPEMIVRRWLWKRGFRYRLNSPKLPGHPDLVLRKYRTCVFVNGCFWHRCPRCNLPLPKSNVEYWVVKFDRNVERDERNLAHLREAGWKVHVIWECQLKKNEIDQTFAELLPVLAEELGKELK